MSPASGTAWRRLVGNGPWRRGHPFGVLDIGSSKLCCYIARPRPGQGVQLLGRGYQLAEGLKARRDRRRRGGRGRDPGRRCTRPSSRPARPCARSVLAVSGGRPQSSYVRVDCALHGRERHRGRPAAPARPRAARGVHARARGAARRAGRGHDRRRAAAQGRLRPVRAAARDRGAPGHRVAGPALRNLLACLERCHVEVKGVVVGELRRGDRLPRRGRAGARLPGPRLGRRHHRPRPLRRRPADAWSARSPMAATTSPATSPTACRPAASMPSGSRTCSAARSSAAATTAPASSIPLLGDHAELPTGEVPRTRITEIVRARVEEILALARRRLRRASRAAGDPAAALDRADRRRQPARGDRGAGPGGVPPAGPLRPAGALVGQAARTSPAAPRPPGPSALVLGDDGGLGWRDQIEVSVLSHRLARLGQWFRENF